MSFFFKNTRKLSLILGVLMLVVTLAAGSFAYLATGFVYASEVSDKPESGSLSEDEVETLESDEIEPQAEPEPEYNVPERMRGVFLVPGTDFYRSRDAASDTVKSEIDKAMDSAAKLGMNAIIVDTVYAKNVVYDTVDAPMLTDFDAMEYIAQKCRDEGLYLYAIFDASHYAGLEKAAANAGEFAMKYRPDGILIDGYIQSDGASAVSYNDYLKNGGSVGLENYTGDASGAVVKAIATAVRKGSPATQAGLLADAVWANESDNALGSETKASSTSLGAGADTKGYVENRIVDFVAVKDYGALTDANVPFGKVVSWWAKVSGAAEIPLYIVHAADKIASQNAGWPAPGEIARQVAEAEKYAGYSGSIFNEVARLAADPQGAATTLKQYMDGAITADEIPASIPQQAVQQPQQTQQETPQSQQQQTQPSSGAAEEPEEIDSIPAEDATPDEPEDAFFDEEEVDAEDDDRSSGWLVDGEVRPAISFAPGTLLKTSSSGIEDGDPVVVTAAQAKTYSPKTTTNIPDPAYYPLPKGAMDYAVGEEIVYKRKADGAIFRYINLKSGMRIATSDIKALSKKFSSNTKITGLTVTAEGDGYTYVTLKMSQKISYQFSYKGDSVQIKFNYTSQVPKNLNLTKNPMFTSATWSGTTLTLKMAKSGGFMGYRGYYDENGNLVLRFNNPPTSIKNARIYVDPGHGGSDKGASTSSSKVWEKDINFAIAKKVTAELEARGATVKLLDTSALGTKQKIEGPQRAAEAEKWNADMIISIHTNTSTNKAAAGTEVYYFRSFSRALASSASANISKQINTNNRGGKWNYFHVTLSSQVPGVLVECGFLTNATEYKKLVKASYHERIATGIADSVQAYIKTANTGVSARGTQSVGGAVTAGSDSSASADDTKSTSSTSTSSSSSSVSASSSADEGLADRGIALNNAGDVRIYNDYLTMYPGNKERVEILSESDKVVRNADFSWKSDSTSVATVDKYGVITARKAGSATITATNGNIKLSCDVVVSNTKVAVTGISLNRTELAIIRGKTAQLKATLQPSNTTETGIVWSSANAKIAKVDSNGVVTGVSNGKTTITARTKTGGFEASCTVEVTRTGVEVEYIELSAEHLEIYKGDTDMLVATVYPENASETGVTWQSSRTSVVTVDEKGNLTAVRVGTATITCTSKADGSIVAKCEVKVID